MLQKIKASLYRDRKELFRNMTLLTSMLLPILLGLMFYYTANRIEEGEARVDLYERMLLIQFYLVYGITLMSVLTFNITTSISEENEKNYYEHVVKTEVDYRATLWSKVILYSVVSIIVLGIVMIAFRPELDFGIFDYLGMACIFIVFIILGISIGLISKNVSQTSAFIIPFMVLIVMTPMGEVVLGPYDEMFLTIGRLNLMYLNMGVYEGHVWQGMIGNLVYIVLSLALLWVCYRKKRLKLE